MIKSPLNIERDQTHTEFPSGMDPNVIDMAILVNNGSWNHDNKEIYINYFIDKIANDQNKERVEDFKKSNNYRTEQFTESRTKKEYTNAINELMVIKKLSDEHVLNKINELIELGHREETIKKMEIFRNYINIENKDVRKEKINNYIEKYL